MRKARLIVGRTTLGILVLAGGATAAQARSADDGRGSVTARDLSPRAVAESLAGEWDGQIEVRAADGALSTSWLAMSAKLAEDGERLELYYEGFAFGKAIEGAMLLNFAENQEGLSIRDRAAGLRASCSPAPATPDAQAPTNSLSMFGNTTGESRDIRAIFSRNDDESWTIEYQARHGDGEWSSMLLMNVSRLEGDRHSAASANFAKSSDLHALRTEHVTAAVDDH